MGTKIHCDRDIDATHASFSASVILELASASHGRYEPRHDSHQPLVPLGELLGQSSRVARPRTAASTISVTRFFDAALKHHPWRALPLLYRFITFFLFALAILAGIHSYFWVRLVRDTQVPLPYRTWTTAICVALACSVPISLMAPRLMPRPWAAYAAWPGYIWLGFMLLLLAALVGTDLLRLILAIGRAVSSRPQLDPAARLRLARALAVAVVVVSAVVGSHSIFQGLREPVVRELRIAIPGLPTALAGTTIVQLTDLHIGATKSRNFASDIVRRSNALSPDVVAITGDLVEGRFGSGREDTLSLAALRARQGVFMVTGNHEYYSGLREWLPELQRLGIRVLRNEHVVIDGDRGGGWELAGIEDWNGGSVEPDGGPDLARALAGHDPTRPLVLLSHQPRAIYSAAQAGVALMLSGHTHGGQIWPFKYLVRLQQPFLEGLHKVGQTQLYVSPGTGYWGPPMRLGTRGEITRITLVSDHL
jgi:predicted MPP superfamily phosphohydrolase